MASVALGVAACSGSGAPESESEPESEPASTSTVSPSAVPSPSDPGAAFPEGDVAVAEVAEALAVVASTSSRAAVDLDTGAFSFDGTATFGTAASGDASLIGTMDFRQSDDDGSYIARNGRVRVEVPDDVDFPSSGVTPPGNPWGPPMARVDPSVVALLVQGLGESAFARRSTSGALVISVKVKGAETLAALGYEPPGFVPDQLDYQIFWDEAGRLGGIEAAFERFGSMSVALDGWTDGPGAAA